MPGDISYILGAVGIFFAILDPFGNLPFFLAYTRDLDPRVMRKTALYLSLFILFAMSFFLITGQLVLSFFGITIPSFQIAGGIILFGVGMSMMSGLHTISINRAISGTDDDDNQPLVQTRSVLPTIIVPLGIPLYVGPGSIAAAILFGSKAPSDTAFFGGLLVIFGIVIFITLLNLASDMIGKMLGTQGIEILVRLMGLILAAIAIQLLLEGIGGATVGIINPVILHQGLA
ncbi:MAG TPA: MarC family protein [Methanospirillum sp.]|nr:MarC family protein [Methanospirillum sp.]